MSTGALENKSRQKSGRAITLPAPPPPRSLLGGTFVGREAEILPFKSNFFCKVQFSK